MEENTESLNSQTEETTAEAETTTTEQTEDVAALKAKLDELEGSNKQLFERAKKAEGFVKVDGKWVKAPKPEEAVRTEQKLEATKGELNETQLDYLDLKGITAKEDIDIIQSVMQRTGQTLRQALSDEYVQTKLKANKDKRDIDAAMPGTSRRASAGSTNDIAWWLAENERTGKLPDDFSLRVKVIEAKERKAGDTKTPPWQR